MAAVITKNAAAAAQRQCDLIVMTNGGLTPAARSTDFIGLGILYQTDGANIPHYKTGTGACVNKRKPLTFTSFTFTADSTTDKLNKVAHGLNTGDGPIGASNAGGGLPAPLAAATDYWVIRVDADNFYFATSLANAYANTRIDITTNGTGTQTAATRTGCSQGIDGLFTYTFPQPDTNFDITEMSVVIDGASGGGYSRANGEGAYTTCNMGSSLTGFEAIGEGSFTYGDLLRITTRALAAKFTLTSGTDFVIRNLADSKNSHSSTVVPTGKTASTIIDPT